MKTNIEMIGILNKKIVKKFHLEHTNGFVYIGPENIEHMRIRHPEDYEIFYEKLSNIISEPDYVAENLRDGSLELVKIFQTDTKEFIKVAVRISSKNTLFARTLYKLNSKKTEWDIEKGYFKKLEEL
ncbi:hypothetical protein IX329_001006 [Fusobacterium necrophorum]|nr:transposase [Fusobacterium necrophorum]MBR8733432.1 hypothetical protein [Fusobacterium necrophorum]MBR8789609.1 hypothetical protein [Fusobacterium necrophorum]